MVLWGYGYFTEETPYDPHFSVQRKASSDHLFAYFRRMVPVTLSNCSNNYGPYHFRRS